CLLLVPESWAILLRYPQTHKPVLTLDNVVYGSWGAGMCLSMTAVVRHLLRPPDKKGLSYSEGILSRCDLSATSAFLPLRLCAQLFSNCTQRRRDCGGERREMRQHSAISLFAQTL